MKRMRLTGIAAYLVATLWHCLPTSAGFFSGNDLYEICRDNGARTANCIHYVTGAVDQLLLLKQTPTHDGKSTVLTASGPQCGFYLPDGVTNSQLTDVVVKYLSDHPETRQWDASMLVWNAIHDAFPCR